jgi:hypothetical protein
LGHSDDTNNCVTEKEKHKVSSQEANIGKSSVEKQLLLLYTAKKSVRIIINRINNTNNNKAVMRGPMQVIILIVNN